MPEAGFHFAQPAWLWALLALLPMAWWLKRSPAHGYQGRIRQYADAYLFPYLTGTRALNPVERWRRFGFWAGLWSLLVIAMAGPRWDFTDVRLFRPGANLVVLLDISKSMDVADVQPSRLARARQEVEDLITQNRELRVGLIAFASVAHVVSPITEDAKSIRGELPAISTDLVDLQGSRLGVALDRAKQLLAGQTEHSTNSILLITDGDFDEPGIEKQVKSLADKGIRLFVLGVGTPGGGPVPARLGRWLTTPAGATVESRLNTEELRASGQGRRRRVHHGRLSRRGHPAHPGARGPGAEGARRRGGRPYAGLERTVLLAGPNSSSVGSAAVSHPLPHGPPGGQEVTLRLRKALALCLLGASSLAAAGWLDNRAQEGSQAFEQGAYLEAASLFDDDYRRGVALYRAGKYREAADAFGRVDRKDVAIDARYNLGNARFRLGQYENAVDAYEQVLTQDPQHADARFNLAIAKAMLLKTDPQAFAKHEQKKEEKKKEEKKQAEQEQQKQAEKKQEQKKQEQQKDQQEKKGEKEKKEKKDQKGEKEKKDQKGEKEQKDQKGEKEQKDQKGEKEQKDQKGEKEQKDQKGEKEQKDQKGEKEQKGQKGEKEQKDQKGEKERERRERRERAEGPERREGPARSEKPRPAVQGEAGRRIKERIGIRERLIEEPGQGQVQGSAEREGIPEGSDRGRKRRQDRRAGGPQRREREAGQAARLQG